MIKMKSEFYALFILYFLALFELHGQRQITTLSGQKVIILQNGSWQKSDKSDGTSDSNAIIGNPDSLINNAVENNNGANNKAIDGINLLINIAEKKEIETFILLDILDKEVAMKDAQLSQARQLKNKETENTLKTDIADLRSKHKTAEKIYKLDAENVKRANNLKKLQGAALIESMTDVGNTFNVNVNKYLPKKNGPISKSAVNSPVLKKSKDKKDVCFLARDEKVNKIRVRETYPAPFYTFTPDKLKNYFKEKELMVANMSVIKKGKAYFLHINLKISSKDAAKNYGNLAKESMMRVQFINGNSTNIYCTEDVYGGIETYTGNVVYNAEYLITKDNMKLLDKNPIDKIGIMWTSGFETYDIYEVDLIMNHFGSI
jgi:hypothetical protein